MADNSNDLLVPWALDAGTDDKPEYTGRDLRDLFAVFFEPRSESEPFQAAPGILRGCTVSATSTEVTVSPGHCIVTTAGGSFLTGVKNPVTLPLSAPHATFNRIDLVALSIEETADSGRGAKIQVIEGTPATYPANPATPDGALILATIRVANTGAPTVTPGVEASLVGASKDPEVTEYSLGAGAKSGQIKSTPLPGGAAVITVDVTMNGQSGEIGQGISGFKDQFVPLGSETDIWWCWLGVRGYLVAKGGVPANGTVISGSFVAKRMER